MSQTRHRVIVGLGIASALAACNRCPSYDEHQFELANSVESSALTATDEPSQVICQGGFDLYIISNPYVLTERWLDKLSIDADAKDALLEFNMAPENPMIAALANGCVVSIRSLGPDFDLEGPSLALRPGDVIAVRRTTNQRPIAISLVSQTIDEEKMPQ